VGEGFLYLSSFTAPSTPPEKFFPFFHSLPGVFLSFLFVVFRKGVLGLWEIPASFLDPLISSSLVVFFSSPF